MVNPMCVLEKKNNELDKIFLFILPGILIKNRLALINRSSLFTHNFRSKHVFNARCKATYC